MLNKLLIDLLYVSRSPTNHRHEELLSNVLVVELVD